MTRKWVVGVGTEAVGDPASSSSIAAPSGAALAEQDPQGDARKGTNQPEGLPEA